MTIRFEVKGIPEVKSLLNKWSNEKKIEVDNGIKQAGYFIQGEVVESIAGHRAETMSVDTGRFKNSIVAIFPKPFTASVETNVEYAKFLEFGTSKIMPRMHFRNTLIRNHSKIVDFIREKIKK